MNNNDRNGKEVNKGQMPDNMQQEGRPKPVHRIKRKSNPVAKDITPPETKKIPLNITKNPGNVQRSTQKGHVIKLEDKESRIHSVETPSRDSTRSDTQQISSSDNTKPLVAPSKEYKTITDNSRTTSTDKEDYRFLSSTSRWLLIIAAILFVAWVVIFFYYKIGGNSHMILALAVISAIISLVNIKHK